MKIKVNWEKVGAYSLGCLFGGGISAIAWHTMEKHGVDPGGIFRKKVVQGNITYYDPSEDPEINQEDLSEDILEDDSNVVEEVSEEEPEQAAPKIYQIDSETWYRSEEDDGYKHAFMKYWEDDQQVSDENYIVIQKPWVLIGTDNYDALSDENGDREMFVRNEDIETDFCITKMEGSLE